MGLHFSRKPKQDRTHDLRIRAESEVSCDYLSSHHHNDTKLKANKSNFFVMTASATMKLPKLDEMALEFKRNVLTKDRTYRFKTYRQCFVASEAVDYLVFSGWAASRQDAVNIGRALQANGLFEHVHRDHRFVDEHLFFRFLDEQERGGTKISEVTGEVVGWNDFLISDDGSVSSLFTDSGGSESLHPVSLPIPDVNALNPNDAYVAKSFWPLDEYNLKLLSNAHPPQWQDPKARSLYDLVVVGGGPGGLISASMAAGVGMKVALVEEHMLGGDCIWMRRFEGSHALRQFGSHSSWRHISLGRGWNIPRPFLRECGFRKSHGARPQNSL